MATEHKENGEISAATTGASSVVETKAISVKTDGVVNGKANGTGELKEETKEEDEKKYADWPFRDIREPHLNDVLYGRGGESL